MSCSVGARPECLPTPSESPPWRRRGYCHRRSHRPGTAPHRHSNSTPMWSAGDVAGTANPADGDAGQIVWWSLALSLTADHDDAEGQGLVVGHFSNIVDRFVAGSVSAYRMALHGTRYLPERIGRRLTVQSTSASDCPCKSILSPCKPWSLISPPIAFRLSSRIKDIRPRFNARNSDDIIIDC